jgi:hypothetical protein
MFVGNKKPMADAVVAVEGEFKFHPETHATPELTVLMMYVSSETKKSYGTCPVKTAMFSPRTFEALRHFLDLAEEDFGRLFFDGGGLHPYDGPEKPRKEDQAETGSIPKGLGG